MLKADCRLYFPAILKQKLTIGHLFWMHSNSTETDFCQQCTYMEIPNNVYYPDIKWLTK